MKTCEHADVMQLVYDAVTIFRSSLNNKKYINYVPTTVNAFVGNAYSGLCSNSLGEAIPSVCVSTMSTNK